MKYHRLNQAPLKPMLPLKQLCLLISLSIYASSSLSMEEEDLDDDSSSMQSFFFFPFSFLLVTKATSSLT